MDFQIDAFLALLAGYNEHIWPLQIVACLLGILSVYLAVRTFKHSSKMISTVLSFFWLWTGLVFCILYWGPSYTPAYPFGVLWIAQGIFFLVSGVLRSDVSFKFRSGPYSVLGLVFILYGLAGYQVFGYFIGHRYPIFFAPGLVPCPTNAFTIGVLLLTDNKLPKYMTIIPFLWSLSGVVPVSKGILEDIGMIVFGVLGVVLIWMRDRKNPKRDKVRR